MTKQHTQQQKHNGLDKDSKCNKKRLEGFKEQNQVLKVILGYILYTDIKITGKKA